MTKKKFNISNWLPNDIPDSKPFSPSGEMSEGQRGQSLPPSSELSEVQIGQIEKIITRIESTHTDITSNYSDWRDIGFAFSDAFGEMGRPYFHRISRFYSGYSQSDCDKQFDACLKSKGHGITLKSFFHLAKQSGIDITSKTNLLASNNLPASVGPDRFNKTTNIVDEPTNPIFNTPQLPSEIYSNLPAILNQSTDLFQESIEKDVFLIGAITVISGCLPNIKGVYFDEPHSAHLFAFITAPAGSGKGKMKWAKYFGQVIHEHLVESTKAEREAYNMEFEKYNNLSRKERMGVDKPLEPPQKMFFIPANSSSSAFIQALADNNFTGVIFETEADTLSATFKQEWGNFSDVLRKAFHHESTSLFRRKDNEFIEIKDPHLAVALSGTPRQVHNMMPDVENGLFSRFLYYAFEDNSDFKNPFVSHRQVNYIDFFRLQGNRIFELHQQLSKLQQPISFMLSSDQARRFTGQFNTMLKRSKLLLGNDFEANIKRLGLITFRIAMVLSALRILETGDLSNPMMCDDTDFSTALSIATTLERHAIAVYQNLPNNELNGIKLKFFEALPERFDRQTYLKTAAELGIKEKAAEKYIGQFKPKLLDHEHKQYTKL